MGRSLREYEFGARRVTRRVDIVAYIQERRPRFLASPQPSEDHRRWLFDNQQRVVGIGN